MKKPLLPNSTREALNEPSTSELYGGGAYKNYVREILQNGINGLVHVEAMKAARCVFNKGENLDEFIEDYQFEEHDGGLLVSLNAVIKPKGIFIPQQKYEGEKDKRIALFTKEHEVIIRKKKQKGYEGIIEQVFERSWKLEDLGSYPLIEAGAIVGEAIWEYYVKNYRDFQKENLDNEKMTPHIEKLIEYYSQIINPPKPESEQRQRLKEMQRLRALAEDVTDEFWWTIKKEGGA